jgi:hypothetical protein
MASLTSVTLVLAAGCSSSSASQDDGSEATEGAQSTVLPDALATVEANPQGPGVVAHVGPSRFVLSGDRVGELEVGKRYKLSLATTTDPKVGDFEVRRLVDFSRVLRLVGTLSDDAQDVAVMHIQTLHAKSYALYGDTVGGYKDIRASLPTHDYSKTLFTVNAVADIGGGAAARWQWLDYTPVARYACQQSDARETHLDLVDVKPDQSLLDGFITTSLGGREQRVGAHAECKRDGDAFACTFDSVGTPWGTARFVRGAANAAFTLTLERADQAKTKVTFACDTTTVEKVSAQSED